MRSLVIVVGLVLVSVLGSTTAFARPKVAVAPITGDTDDQIGAVVVEVLTPTAKVVGTSDFERALPKSRRGKELDDDDLERVRDKLGLSVVVQGKLKKTGKKWTLSLSVSSKNKKPAKFSMVFKSAASDKFRDSLRIELGKRIEAEEEAAEDPEPRRKKDKEVADDGEPRRKKDKEATDDGEPRRKKDKEATDDGEPRRKKDKEVAEGDGDGEPRIKRKRKRDEDGEPSARTARTAVQQAAVRVDAGGTYGLRRLTWDSGAMGPPTVSTPSPSVRVEGELYPFALANPRGALRGFGLFGEYDKTLLLAIKVPGTNTSSSIDQAHFAVGARYRIEVGAAASVAIGASYQRRHTIADRSGLMMPTQLDTPDVDYSAIAPGLGFRAPLTPAIMLFADAAGMLVLDTGPIQKSTSYGSATVYGFGGDAGLDIGLTKQIVLRLAGEYSQINLSFNAKTGSMAQARGVKSATDRSFGLAATLAVVY